VSVKHIIQDTPWDISFGYHELNLKNLLTLFVTLTLTLTSAVIDIISNFY